MKITEEAFKAFVRKEFPGKECHWEYRDGHGYMAIQAGNGKEFSFPNVCYKFYNGHVRVHIEGERLWWLRLELAYILKQHSELHGEVLQKRQILDSEQEDIFEQFLKIREIVEPVLKGYENEEKGIVNAIYLELSSEEIYRLKLNIPKYQRIYTWGYEQVKTLLDDIANIKVERYFVGAVILHIQEDKEKQDIFNIVDGQQRLVTIALIKYALHADENNLPQDLQRFLNCEYASLDAQIRLSENLRIIKNYLSDEDRKCRIQSNLPKIAFSVLTINKTENLDLAFTFFSNTNSKGKKLSDYDLLKPHHLRYIPSDLEDQQMHLSQKWDSMINKERNLETEKLENIDGREQIQYIRVMELMLYRLRNWEQSRNGTETADFYIKKEFESAPIINEIPPFGERFDYWEPIQGGQHFFAYVDHFIDQYEKFDKKVLIQNVFRSIRTDTWYGNVIEALAFCYYLKFGNRYIDEAIMSIVRYVSIIRFRLARAYKPTILDWVRRSNIVMDINRSTSPTFFLASIENHIDNPPEDPYKHEDATTGIRKHFLDDCCLPLTRMLMKSSMVQYYKNYDKDRYGQFC